MPVPTPTIPLSRLPILRLPLPRLLSVLLPALLLFSFHLSPCAPAAPRKGGSGDGGLWVEKKLVFDSGTTVTVVAPQALDKERMYLVAKQVKFVTKNRASSCFCKFKPTVAPLVFDGHVDTFGDVDCACQEKSSGLMEATPPSVPTDIYGVLDNTPYERRFRYNAGSATFVSRGLVFCVDAGDRKSYTGGEGKAHAWTDVSNGGRKTVLQGGVTWTASEGYGAMRFGARGPGDLMTIAGLDIGPRSMKAFSVELWIKLVSIPNGRGWVFGNDATTPNTGVDSQDYDRGLFMHDTRFSPQRSPPNASAVEAAEWGRSAMGVGHEYQSLMMAPAVGKWVHMVGVWRQGGSSELYRNTVRQDVEPSRTFNFDGMRDAVLGGHRHLAHYHVDAHIAALRIYNVPLREREVQRNYDFSAPRFGISTPPTRDEIRAFNPHFEDMGKRRR